MAVVTDLLQTYDQSDTNDYSIAMGVHTAETIDTTLQRLLAKVQVGAIKQEWIEDDLISNRSALSATVANTTVTTIAITAGDGTAKYADAANVKMIIKVDQEYMLVSGRSTDTLTVERGYHSSTAATHASAAVILKISEVAYEGADAKLAVTAVRTRPSNYTQTFHRSIEVSGPQEAVRHLGGIGSEMEYDIVQAMKHLANELEITLIHGKAATVGDGSSSHRTMAGLNGLITTNVTDQNAAYGTAIIEADILTCWENGGNPNLILCDGNGAQAITNLYADRVRTDVLFQLGGSNITAIVNPLAQGTIFIVPHRHLIQEYFMIDMSKVVLGYLRPFFMKDLADAGDADKRAIYGDYTLELMNEKVHAHSYRLT